ncbi:MAG: translation initiation factor IF-2 N-terminal domain-containing protein, partial [Phycisphaerales bacterium]|nr:translation initiation factor IF-2 N-terminal domain-containing protein [Phycisphaerales bacterium]
MAKKSTTIRVHQVAKEMGVSSKDIIAKCQDEAIADITNHMSALSIGLAATVREWFSDSAKSTTTVETAAPVDVAKVKKKAKKTTRKKTKKKSGDASQGRKASDRSAPPKSHVPQQPEDVKPAGRRLDQPARVQLSGPKVIRVERPEPEPAPPRRPPQSQPAVPQGGAGVTTPPPPGRERGSRRNKRRSGGGASTAPDRGSRTPQQDSGKDSSWRRQDLLERENRLKRSGGFFRAARRDSQKRSSGKPAVRAKTIAETGGNVTVSEPILIKDLSAATGVKANRILKQLHLAEIPATVNDTIDADVAIEMMLEMGIELDVQRQQS